MKLSNLVRHLAKKPNQNDEVEFIIYRRDTNEVVCVDLSGATTMDIMKLVATRTKPKEIERWRQPRQGDRFTEGSTILEVAAIADGQVWYNVVLTGRGAAATNHQLSIEDFISNAERALSKGAKFTPIESA